MPDLLRDRIRGAGPITFAEFMTAALYEPELGYYAKGSRQVGRGGDFFTSVSVGSLFGELLARRFLRAWRDSGQPTAWRIIECGAHDGKLAADVLRALRELDSAAFAALEYVIPEPLAHLQAAQRQTLAGFLPNVRLIADAAELASRPLPGVAFGNELLDALPFHIVEWNGRQWHECRVGLSSAGDFIWARENITDPALSSALVPMGEGFPPGYRTEIRTCFADFLIPLARALNDGLMIWADYGFARDDYYHPARSSGTLRTFSKHRAGEDPLACPGEADITAHVDFTILAETAAALGGRITSFRNQGAWITENAREWLLSQEGKPHPALLRQFQTLTHPAHLGGSFHFIEISWVAATGSPDPTLEHRLFLRPA